MPRLPKITGKKLVKILFKFGFSIARSRGSHLVLKNDDGKLTVVPVHSGEIIGPSLLKKILQDCDITKEKLKDMLNQH